jgi:hypothetical protein
MTIDVKIVCAVLQVHGKNQSHQSEVMITMQVTYENMIDPVKVYLETHELHWASFAAVNQEITILNFNQLR